METRVLCARRTAGERALRQQNIELPSGRVENLQREMTIQTRGEMKTPEEFNNLILRADAARLVRLRDIGEARAGVENERTIARNNGRPCIFLGIVKQSKPLSRRAVQANYASLNDPALKALVPQLYTKGGLKYVGVDDDQTYNTPKNTFLPRVGFAYQLAPKTVVRGGVGLFAGFLGQRRGDVITTGYTQTTTIPTTFNAYGSPVPIDWANALLSTPILEPVGNANGKQTFLGNTITFFNPDPKVSKQLRWQVGIQHQLPGNWVGEAVYVGNYGYDIEIVRNINSLPAQYLNTDNSRTAAMNANNSFLSGSVANPFAGLLPGTSFNNPTIARRQLMRPYPQFSDINTINVHGDLLISVLQL